MQPEIIDSDARLSEIFRQAKYRIPVVMITRKGEPLWLIMPYFDGCSVWLQGDHSRHNHHYKKHASPQHWELPRTWLDDLVRRLIVRFGACYVVQSYREMEKCAPACWEAKGIECECSCMGEHHGEGHPDGRWYEVSETCALSWGPRKLSCKLLKPKRPKRLT